ncbi:MAG TPA: hypothetical protein VER79_11605 [Candidatus Limnocylindrales bacterium]|nr:hypothetical protein [Candidatus Limnocylindrales bacterium]
MTLRRLLAAAVFVAAITLILTVPQSTSDPFAGYAITGAPFTSLTYGIQTFLWWDNGWAGVHMDWVQRMVFSHVKQTFAWEDIQPARDLWLFGRGDEILNELERRDLKLVVRLTDAPEWSHPNQPGERGVDFVDAPPDDPADFGRYCGAVAERYQGRVAAYQIWNEPNLSREWGGRQPDAAGYVLLLKACSEAIRAADPAAILISAGLAPTGNWDATATPDDLFLQQLYDAGFQQYVDVVGVHAPGYTAPDVAPEDAPGGNRFFSFRRVEDLRRIMVANGDAARQMAILEVGYTTDSVHPEMSWFSVSEEEQAQRLVEAFAYAAGHWSPWVGLMSTIYIADPAWTPDNEEFWWAVTTPDGYTRPAYIELANMAKYCGDDYRPSRAPDSPEALGLAPIRPCS